MRVNVYLRNYVTSKGEKRWYLVVREKGRRDHQVQLGMIGRQTAEERRVIVLNELLTGTYRTVSTVRPLFGEWCDRVLTKFLAGTRAPRTIELYKERLVSFRKLFDDRRLDEIRREDVEHFLCEMPVANRTKNMTLSTLRLIFAKAVDWHYLIKSPVIEISRSHEESEGSRALTEQELGRVLDLATPWERSVIRVMVLTGMRPGELSQLKFEDISWDTDTLRVVSDHTRKTKNRKSRVVPLSPDLAKELHFLRENWPNMNQTTGKEKGPFLPRSAEQKEYLFCHPDGRPVRSFRKAIMTAFRRVGVKGVTPHGLRKTFCTLLARQGVHPRVAQQLLGHSDVRLTMNIYTEVQDDQLRAAVNSLPSNRSLQKEKFRLVQEWA